MTVYLVLFSIFFIFFAFYGEVTYTHTYKNGKKEDVPAGCLVTCIFIFVLSIISATIFGTLLIGLYELVKFIF